MAQQENTEKQYIPLDGVVEKKIAKERRVLPYQPIREADIMWEKRIWRVIDTREKINLPFRYPKKMFFNLLVESITKNNLTAYEINDNEDFSEPLTTEEVNQKLYEVDTFVSFDPITYKETIEIVHNDMNPEDITRFRLKEVWFFDEQTSTLNVRILGIAPLKEEFDEQGNFLYEIPMFWIYYPDARELFARETVFNGGNDHQQMSWTDLFEMRQFSSYIYKESNVFDRQIQHYLQGIDILLESEKINSSIFNFEHDLWTY